MTGRPVYVKQGDQGVRLQQYPAMLRSIVDTQLSQLSSCVQGIQEYVSGKSTVPCLGDLDLKALDSQIGKQIDSHIATNKGKAKPQLLSDFLPYHSILRTARDLRISTYDRTHRLLYGIRGLAFKGFVNQSENKSREFV